VDVRVEEAGDDCAPTEIDSAGVWRERAFRADARNAAVSNRDRRRHHAAAVDEAAVDERELRERLRCRDAGRLRGEVEGPSADNRGEASGGGRKDPATRKPSVRHG
jgi:hypothetical protein